MRRLAGLFQDRGVRQRALLFALCGLAAFYIGYFGIPTVVAGHFIIQFGYYYILGVFGCFVLFAWKLARSRVPVWSAWLRRPGIAGLAIAAGTLFAVWSDSFRHKILYDEFVIQGTAYVMHTLKQVSTILRAYNIDGTWLPIDLYLDKRPYFFPFLVSLLHDLTGYRVANMFALNVACGAALLGLLYWFVRELSGRSAALFAVGIFALMPLFGQNATGAGMDLHNLTMVALTACLGVLYLRIPSDDRLSVFVLCAVLLTQSRYESIVFLLPVALVVLAGWFRAGRAVLPWPALIAPLLLIPYAWHSRVLAATPVFWQLQQGQTSAFGASNIAGNFSGDMEFLFNTGPGLANSWYLSACGVLGLVGLGYVGWKWLRTQPRPEWSAASLVGLAFLLGVAAHFVILLFYWWAKFNDLMASRFALPVSLAFAVLSAGLFGALDGRPIPARLTRWVGDRRIPALHLAWVGLGVWLLIGGLPAMAIKFYTNQNLGMQELDWEHGIIQSRSGPIFFISNKSTIPFILWRIETSLNSVAAQRGADIRYHMGQDTFKEVIVAQAVRPITPAGGMGVDPDDVMPVTFHLQEIAEKRFGARIDRLSRIVSIDPEPPPAKKPDQRPSVPSALRSISELQSRSEPAVAALTSSAFNR